MRPTPLTVVAVFQARPGQGEALEAALSAMLAPTRRERGCVNYDLHRSEDKPGLFFFHETWQSADDHRIHLETSHVRHLLAISPDLLREPIREYKGRRIEP